ASVTLLRPCRFRLSSFYSPRAAIFEASSGDVRRSSEPSIGNLKTRCGPGTGFDLVPRTPDCLLVRDAALPSSGPHHQAHQSPPVGAITTRSEEHTSELQSHSDLVCR